MMPKDWGCVTNFTPAKKERKDGARCAALPCTGTYPTKLANPGVSLGQVRQKRGARSIPPRCAGTYCPAPCRRAGQNVNPALALSTFCRLMLWASTGNCIAASPIRPLSHLTKFRNSIRWDRSSTSGHDRLLVYPSVDDGTNNTPAAGPGLALLVRRS